MGLILNSEQQKKTNMKSTDFNKMVRFWRAGRAAEDAHGPLRHPKTIPDHLTIAVEPTTSRFQKEP